jgi:hypothetical protein
MKTTVAVEAHKTVREELNGQAERFARGLDREAYAEVKTLFAVECSYHTSKGVILGRDAIVESYRQAAEQGRKRFDRVEFTSQVIKATREGATVLFLDRVTKGGVTHTYSCKQFLAFNKASEIVRIEQEELPGERQRFVEYCLRQGVEVE